MSSRSAHPSYSRAWSFAHSSAAHASASFCPDCQRSDAAPDAAAALSGRSRSDILDLPDADLILRCPVCPFQVRFSGEDARYEKLSISTKYSTASAAEDGGAAPAPVFTRAKVKERCPQCNNPEMSFYTMQMRSVDEGQTVFFECNKCGHTFSTNT